MGSLSTQAGVHSVDFPPRAVQVPGGPMRQGLALAPKKPFHFYVTAGQGMGLGTEREERGPWRKHRLPSKRQQQGGYWAGGMTK